MSTTTTTDSNRTKSTLASGEESVGEEGQALLRRYSSRGSKSDRSSVASQSSLFGKAGKKRKKTSMDGKARTGSALAANLGKTVTTMTAIIGDDITKDNLHLLARSNQVSAIRDYASTREIDQLKMDLMRVNDDGNTPAMVAALHNNKEALLALLGPFFVIPQDEDIDGLLHHRNKKGQTLLAIVTLHMESLFAAHALLVEFEAASHNWDSYRVQKCFRNSLGSNRGAIATLALYKRIKRDHGKKKFTTSTITLVVKIFGLMLLVRSFFLVLDVVTDVMLLFEYLEHFDTWDSTEEGHVGGILYPGEQDIIRDPPPCFASETIESDDGNPLSHYVINKSNVSLTCYSKLISGRSRFIATLIIIMLPFLFYFFELLRFRTFSKWLETKVNVGQLNSCVYYGLFKPFKLLVNLVLLLAWPIVAFFRQAYYLFIYESSRDADKAGKHREASKLASTIGSRTQIIEVCTEASLQPLLQLYFVLINMFVFTTQEELKKEGINIFEPRQPSFVDIDVDRWIEQIEAVLKFIADGEKRRILSTIVSILAIAVSYTIQYRSNKEKALGIGPSIVYFTYICLAVISRILCFEMFAFFLGPGQLHYAMLAVGGHVLLMTLVHFVFSDSLRQCAKRSDQLWSSWTRQVLLVVHNCFVNGLANIYVHNNLEIFVKYSTTTTTGNNNFVRSSSSTSSESDRDAVKSRKKSIGYEGATYSVSDRRRRTLIRQTVIDLIIFLENFAMIYLARLTITSTSNFNQIYFVIVLIVATCYFSAYALKFLYYWTCHPWSDLIRPQKCSTTTATPYRTSCVIFSKQIDLEIGGSTSGCCFKCSFCREEDGGKSRHPSLRSKPSHCIGAGV